MKRSEIIEGLHRVSALVGASARESCIAACVEIQALALSVKEAIHQRDEHAQEARQAWDETKRLIERAEGLLHAMDAAGVSGLGMPEDDLRDLIASIKGV